MYIHDYILHVQYLLKYTYVHTSRTTDSSAHLIMSVGRLLLQQLNLSSQFGYADVFLCNLLHIVFVDLPQTRHFTLQVHQLLTAFRHLVLQ